MVFFEPFSTQKWQNPQKKCFFHIFCIYKHCLPSNTCFLMVSTTSMVFLGPAEAFLAKMACFENLSPDSITTKISTSLFYLVWFNDNLSKNTTLRVNAMFLARYWTTSLWPAFCAHCAHCNKKMTLGLWSEKNWNVALCLWKYGRWKKFEILLVDIMKCSLMDIVCIDCHLIWVNVVKFHLAVAPSQLVTSLQWFTLN